MKKQIIDTFIFHKFHNKHMPRKGNILPKAPLLRIAKSHGAKRISDEALDTFSTLLQQFAEKISTQALRIAKHSGRKTVIHSDIKLALK